MGKKSPTPKRQWQPMKPGVITNREKIEERLKDLDIDFDLNNAMREVWVNDKYVVHVDRNAEGDVACLSIRRQDRGWPRDWRDFQRIKNEIAGPEVEAVELYPAESRLVDTANQFWLWCLRPGEILDVGFHHREVAGSAEATPLGAKQRDFDTYPNISGSV